MRNKNCGNWLQGGFLVQIIENISSPQLNLLTNYTYYCYILGEKGGSERRERTGGEEGRFGTYSHGQPHTLYKYRAGTFGSLVRNGFDVMNSSVRF